MGNDQTKHIWENAHRFTETASTANEADFQPVVILVAGDAIHPELGKDYTENGDLNEAATLIDERNSLVEQLYRSVIDGLRMGGIEEAKRIARDSNFQTIFICTSREEVRTNLRELHNYGMCPTAFSDSNLDVLKTYCVVTFAEDYSYLIELR